jgi:hypothetical protein
MKKCLSVVLAVLISTVAAHAERPPQSQDKAKLVVSATVKKITTTTSAFGSTGVRTDYTAEVVVDAVEKGENVKPGDTISVTWFHVTKKPDPKEMLVGAFGHAYPIAEKDQAKFWLMDRGPGVPKGVWVIIYNKNGVEKIEK